MKVNINGKEYFFRNDIRDNDSIRHSFNELAQKTFSINFEGWYQNGFWKEDYIPYVLLDGDTVAANVSVNFMHANYKNEERFFIQLGTVMTDERYRKHGLSRWIIERILEEWKEKCDGIYLYANRNVLDFYPKFGFVKEQEYQAFSNVTKMKAEIRKMDMESEDDRKMLYEKKYALTNQFAELTLNSNTGLLMFYCSQFLKENVYYLPQYDLAVIAKYNGDKLICYDIFGQTDVALNEILSVMANEDTKECEFGFTPKDKDVLSFKEVNFDDNTLFWISDKENIFDNYAKLMFPMLSHA